VLPTGQKVIVTGQVTSQSDPPEAECGSQDRNLPGCNLDPPKLKQRSKLGRRQPRPPEPRQKGRNLPDCYLDPPDPPEPKQTKSRSQLARLRPQALGTQTKIGTWHVTTSIPQNPNGGRSSQGCVLDPPKPKKMSKLRGSEVIKVEISQVATSIARNSAGYVRPRCSRTQTEAKACQAMRSTPQFTDRGRNWKVKSSTPKMARG
jgi:hypothetical protein